MAHAEITEATSIQSELWPLSKEKKKKLKQKQNNTEKKQSKPQITTKLVKRVLEVNVLI